MLRKKNRITVGISSITKLSNGLFQMLFSDSVGITALDFPSENPMLGSSKLHGWFLHCLIVIEEKLYPILCLSPKVCK